MTPPLRAFHGDATLKAALLVEIGKHEAADAIVKGQYGEAELDVAHFKGCAIGCALHSLNAIEGQTNKSVSDRSRFPTELGIPIELAYHIDMTFENLSDAEGQTWPRRVIEAIPPGADLDGIVPALLQWTILDPKFGFAALAQPEFHEAYTRLAALVARDWADSGSVRLSEWDAIDDALAQCQVWAWAWAWAGAGARAGAWAGARVWAGARAGARARAGAYSQLSEETLRLLRAAPCDQP